MLDLCFHCRRSECVITQYFVKVQFRVEDKVCKVFFYMFLRSMFNYYLMFLRSMFILGVFVGEGNVRVNS